MVMKLNNTGKPIFVEGRLIAAGTFYDAKEEVEFVTTGNPINENIFEIPKLEDITVPQIKEKFEEWGVDFSTGGKEKAVVYAVFVEEAKRRGGFEQADTTGASTD
ncbi:MULTISPECIES: hypothetical protein [unclassified Paenibacillus]|uniref:hypothetical protein n=1 Tax=unclassified Paenibacillus TaxID=185978 RepID=UPI003631A262